jgi:hypothetical protein
MKVKDLSPNPKNPRKISDSKLEQLKNALAEFGDLGCIIYNRKTGQLVGGHQRVKTVDPSANVQIEKKYSKPTKVGTVAEGFIEISGERFKYREVIWDETKEKAANIAANKAAGEFDFGVLGELFDELQDFGFDLDLTMFDGDERDQYILSDETNFGPGDESDQGQLDRKKPVTCPHCGEEFIPG